MKFLLLFPPQMLDEASPPAAFCDYRKPPNPNCTLKSVWKDLKSEGDSSLEEDDFCDFLSCPSSRVSVLQLTVLHQQ